MLFQPLPYDMLVTYKTRYRTDDTTDLRHCFPNTTRRTQPLPSYTKVRIVASAPARGGRWCSRCSRSRCSPPCGHTLATGRLWGRHCSTSCRRRSRRSRSTSRPVSFRKIPMAKSTFKIGYCYDTWWYCDDIARAFFAYVYIYWLLFLGYFLYHPYRTSTIPHGLSMINTKRSNI